MNTKINMSTSKNQDQATPSPTLVQDGTQGGNSTPVSPPLRLWIRPGTLSSMGKYFKRRMSRSKSPKSDKELVSSPHEPKSHSPVDTPPSTDLNVIEERYLKVLGSTADKEVNEILLACGIARKESTILIQKGRLHSIRKFLTLTEEKWSQLMTISNNLSINNFKSIVSFQLWYYEPKNSKFQQDPSIMLAKLWDGNFRQYLQDLSLSLSSKPKSKTK